MKLALAQIDIVWENKLKNKEKCLNFIKESSSQGVKLLLFPEMTLTGFSMKVSDIGESNDESINWFKEQTKLYNIYIGFGYVRKTLGNNIASNLLNSVISCNSHSSLTSLGENKFCVITPDGSILSNYTKIHPFSFGEENKFYVSGNDLCYFNINYFIVSTFICYDLRFPEIFQAASKKATLITVAANWPEVRREHWISLLKARAIENQCYIAGINRVGDDPKLHYSGDSMIIDPLGNVISALYDSEGLVIADIDLDYVNGVRKSFRVKEDRKDDLYLKLMNS